MIPFERQFQTLHSLQNYFLLNELLAPGLPMPIVDTEALRRARAAFVAAVRRPAVLLRPGRDAAGAARRSRPGPLAADARLRVRPAGHASARRSPCWPSAAPDARPLAGGTDLIIRLRDGSIRPEVVVDVKAIRGARRRRSGRRRRPAGHRGAGRDDRHRRRPARPAPLPRPRRGGAGRRRRSQIRNRATLAGNLCNASPAADTAPGAARLRRGRWSRPGRRASGGSRSTSFWVRSGVTTLGRGELVTAIELPVPDAPHGSVHQRRTRRRGHDLASVTLACAVGRRRGHARSRYGSVGPRPAAARSTTPACSPTRRRRTTRRLRCSTRCSPARAPSPTSMRASPEYRLAMLRVLGRRAVDARRSGALAAEAPAHDATPSPIALTVNGPRRERRGRAAPHAARRAARRPRADRHQGVLPRRRVRRVHGAGRRPERGRVPGARRRGRRLGRHDRRGAGRRRPARAPLQDAFLDTGAAQCGFCIPGQLLSAQALLADVPHPTRAEVEEGLAGNLCRCAGYEQIIEAVLAGGRAAGRRGAGRPAPGRSPARRRRDRRRGPSRRRGRAAMSGRTRRRRPRPSSAARLARRRPRPGDRPPGLRRRPPARGRPPRQARHGRRRPGADRPDRRDRARSRCPGVRLVMTARRPARRRCRASGPSCGTGRCWPSARPRTTASRWRPSRPRPGTRPRRPPRWSTSSSRPLPAVTTIAAALDPASPLVQDPALRPDDPLADDQRPARAPRSAGATSRPRSARPTSIVEGTYAFPMVTQFAIEPHAFMAAPDGDGIAVWSAIQHPYWLQRVIADAARAAAVQGPRVRAGPGRRVRRQAARQVRAAARVHGAPRSGARCGWC